MISYATLSSGLEVERKKCRYGPRIEAPKAPRGVGVRGEGVPSPSGLSLGRGLCPLQEKF